MCVITLNENEEGGRRPGNGREGREAAIEGRAGGGLLAFLARRWAGAGGRGRGGQALRCGVAAARTLAEEGRAGAIFVSAAP